MIDFLNKAPILAKNSLKKELECYPKPGLVSYIDSGSHEDMNHKTFVSSINSLSDYFFEISEAAYKGYGFSEFKNLGIKAEEKMLIATNGINTHRGAIFSIGLLLASTVYELRENKKININSICEGVGKRWGINILNNEINKISNGIKIKKKYYYGGAREEAASGYETLRKYIIPEYIKAEDSGFSENRKHIQCLMKSISELSDTNILHRGGLLSLYLSKNIASDFLNNGGCYNDNYYEEMLLIHDLFKTKNISPGGSADLLSAIIFLKSLEEICL